MSDSKATDLEWHGSKAYSRCPVCGKLVRMTGFMGGLHLCLTLCERIGHDIVKRRRGVWPFRYDQLLCRRCKQTERIGAKRESA